MASGRDLFVQFRATTGDAMGMNMVSKGTEHALRHIKVYIHTHTDKPDFVTAIEFIKRLLYSFHDQY